MQLEEQIVVAIQIATKAHKNQFDKGGQPYILHPIHVMNQVKTLEEKIVGVLHDVVEDSSYTFEDLLESGISEDLVACLRLLTHSEDKSYEVYIRNIHDSGNQMAINVKLADLEHNSDLRRLKEVGQKEINRFNKYQYCIGILH